MYLVLCAALQLHKLSIRCFIMLSTNDFHWVSLVRQIIDISRRWWSSNGIMLKANLPCLCWRSWYNRRGRGRGRAGRSRRKSRRRSWPLGSRRSKGGAWNRKKGDIVCSSAKILLNLACNLKQCLTPFRANGQKCNNILYNITSWKRILIHLMSVKQANKARRIDESKQCYLRRYIFRFG